MAAYARGLADLGTLASLLTDRGFLFGPKPRGAGAGLYGFTANIHFYDIDTPLKRFLASKPNLVAHRLAIHRVIAG